MKKIILTSLISLSVILGYGQKKGYWSNFSIHPRFNTSAEYKVGVLPVVSAETGLEEIAMNEIITQLAGIGKFQMINKQMMTEAVNTYRFGGGPVTAANYADICKATGAQLLVYCELSRDKTVIKKKEVGTVMAWVQLLDASSDFSAVYTGKARLMNPLSAQAETEGAIRKALEMLVTKMQ